MEVFKTIKSYDKALKIYAEDSMALYNNFCDLLKLGELDEAIKYYKKYIVYPFHNYNTVRFSGFGRIDDGFHYLPSLGEVEDIKRYALQQLDPNHKDTWYVKGLVCLGLGEYNEAIMYYDKILEVDPNYM